MYELINLEIPVKIPLLDVAIGDIQVEVRPSEFLPLPIIHVEAKLDIWLGF